jgi:hypothetical protein
MLLLKEAELHLNTLGKRLRDGQQLEVEVVYTTGLRSRFYADSGAFPAMLQPLPEWISTILVGVNPRSAVSAARWLAEVHGTPMPPRAAKEEDIDTVNCIRLDIDHERPCSWATLERIKAEYNKMGLDAPPEAYRQAERFAAVSGRRAADLVYLNQVSPKLGVATRRASQRCAATDGMRNAVFLAAETLSKKLSLLMSPEDLVVTHDSGNGAHLWVWFRPIPVNHDPDTLKTALTAFESFCRRSLIDFPFVTLDPYGGLAAKGRLAGTWNAKAGRYCVRIETQTGSKGDGLFALLNDLRANARYARDIADTHPLPASRAYRGDAAEHLAELISEYPMVGVGHDEALKNLLRICGGMLRRYGDVGKSLCLAMRPEQDQWSTHGFRREIEKAVEKGQSGVRYFR